jgi:CubicO group peptidase (beta-lactamase class C family)
MSVADYAKEKLFKPFGISGYEWDEDPQGRNWGYANLKL